MTVSSAEVVARLVELGQTVGCAESLTGGLVVARLVDVFGEKVFHTVIARTVKFPDSSAASQPMTQYAPTHPGTQAYRQLARELVARGLVA